MRKLKILLVSIVIYLIRTMLTKYVFASPDNYLSIPSADIGVRVVCVDRNMPDAFLKLQEAIDAENTAGASVRENGLLISDHRTQDFLLLPDVKTGDTAVLYDDDGNSYRFVCAGMNRCAVRSGSWHCDCTGKDYVYENSTLVDAYDVPVLAEYAYPLFISTCAVEDGSEQYVTYWELC